jgi:GxxExxY protein
MGLAATGHDDITYRIIGAALRVHNALGPGLREGIYQRALSQEMAADGLSFEEEKPAEVFLDGVRVGLLYLDHLVEDAIVVQTKALRHRLTQDEVGQVITYLAATGHKVGLLFNFAGHSLEYKRILPPRKLDDWKQRIRRYAWTPREAHGG